MIDLRRATEMALTSRLAGARGRGVFIWGAGSAGRRAGAMLQSIGGDYAGFIDRDAAKCGTEVDGHTVFTPDRLLRDGARPRVLIASMYAQEIGGQLRSMGFRPHRDFDVLPAGGELMPLASADAQTYAAWHVQWLETLGIAAPQSRDRRVRSVAVPDSAAWSRISRRLRAALPAGDEAWVCLHDERFKGAGVYWRHGRQPETDCRSVEAVYDLAPPPGRQYRPFLLAALEASAMAAPPVILRVADLRRYLAARPAPTFSLEHLVAWAGRVLPRSSGHHGAIVRVSSTAGTSVAQVGSAAGPTGERTRRLSRATGAPALLAFTRAVSETGGPVFSPDELKTRLRFWVDHLPETAGWEYLQVKDRPSPAGLRLQVLAHSRGNFFFREIRDLLAAAWKRAGAQVRVGDETTSPAGPSWHKVIVAPHEYFVLPGRDSRWDSADQLVMFNTEQPHTRWFAACLPRLLACRLVLDLNWQTALLLRLLGADAHFLPLGWDDDAPSPRRRLQATLPFAGMSERDRALPSGNEWADRPIDALFVGTLSQRRGDLLAGMASELARRRCYVHLPPADRPIVPGEVDALSGRDMTDLCRRAKIVLNLHRDEMPYFEWHRLVFQAMRQGALVLTESAMRVPGLVPGRHFVEAPAGQMPGMIAHLLDSRSGLREARRIARAGSQALRCRFHTDRIARRSLALLTT